MAAEFTPPSGDVLERRAASGSDDTETQLIPAWAAQPAVAPPRDARSVPPAPAPSAPAPSAPVPSAPVPSAPAPSVAPPAPVAPQGPVTPQASASHPAAAAPVVPAAPSWPAGMRAWPPVDVRRLRHPSEPARFTVAAAAAILLIGLGLLLAARLAGPRWIISIGAVLILAAAANYCVAQLYQAYLFGQAARVTPGTFPALAAAISDARQRLGYARPAEVFVAGRARPALLTSAFGPHLLVLPGDLAADLGTPGNRAQLDFVLGTFFGALKARSLSWAPARVVIDLLRLPRVLNFLIAPWDRAIVYTGDQVAAMCCGSVDESMFALSRLLVGKHLAAEVGMTGLLRQTTSVRRQWLPRLPLLYARSPQLTSRYLNLLSFAGYAAPDQAAAFRQRLGSGTERSLREALSRPARLHRRGPRSTALPAVCIAVSVALLGTAGYGLYSPQAQHVLVSLRLAAATSSPATSLPPASLPGPAPVPPAPSASRPLPVTSSSAAGALEAHVPAAFAGTCSPFTPQQATGGLVAAVTCTPAGAGAPGHVEYYQYASASDMNGTFEHYVHGLPAAGTCDQGGQRGTYHFVGGAADGMWACFSDTSRISQMLWTSDSLNILTSANDQSQTPQEVHDWFFSPAQTGPR